MNKLPLLAAKKDSDSERKSRILNSKEVFYKVTNNIVEEYSKEFSKIT